MMQDDTGTAGDDSLPFSRLNGAPHPLFNQVNYW